MDEDKTNIFLSLFLTCLIFTLYVFYAFSERCIVCILLIVLYSTCFTKKMDWMTGNVFQKTPNSSNACVKKQKKQQQNFLVINNSYYSLCTNLCQKYLLRMYFILFYLEFYIQKSTCPHFCTFCCCSFTSTSTFASKESAAHSKRDLPFTHLCCKFGSEY